MWFDSWPDVGRILLLGSTSYIALLLILRASGKRTLSQLNAFDFIVTVALGSTLATILLSSDVSFVEGVAALGLLAALQLLAALVSSRWSRGRRILTSEPRRLLADGRMDTAALAETRLTESEVLQVLRSQGVGDVSLVAAVVLETDGTLSVIQSRRFGDGSAMEGVR